ncbi:class I SAM-dependent methyltransferase [Phycicoccus sonneratiae]|uniref:Methyltransferase domain-containing protein n=1 Tax=Phycicoccus sonneratiae TaxID=2807628 RepID=A0ABS2CRH9_9MICO|nr:methyltransferase domain-containing protein [Phycicoccus sonneraticus]MBM6401741.1 methyltransferase domain-containing protein [Phycicoccus sonneraticus]
MTVHHHAPAPPEVKARHRAVWALGDYPSVAERVIPTLGPVLVEACGVGPGDKVLDVAAGSGNASLPAARLGADVTASDLTPELLAVGREHAEAAGLELLWDVADAEDLPYPDATFDVVLSCVGVMFAPIHEAAADELVRVCRPGGRIGLLSWTPEGFIGRLLAALRPWAPPPPSGAQPPPLWGSADHVRSLLGDAVTDLRAERRELVVDTFTTPEEFRRFFVERYGPTAAVHRSQAGDPEQQAAVEAALDALAREADEGGGRMRWEYLLVTAIRA